MQTRRVTLVRFLRGENGFSSAQLKEAFAVPGTPEFLTRVQSEGISNSEVADRLVAFKNAGGSGLQNAINSINAELDAINAPSAAVEGDSQLEAIKGQLETLLGVVNEALGA